MSKNKDQIYIDKVLQGNTQAYTYLVDTYKDLVFTITNNIVKNYTEAEDISQEVFIKAFKQLNSFKGDSKFSTWLYTIAFRTAISAKRKSGLILKDIDEHILNNYSDDGLVNQLKLLQQKDQKYFINQAINTLPELDALVLTLYYLHENTTEEIEEITGMTKSNIKVRMHRARKKLALSLLNILPEEYALHL